MVELKSLNGERPLTGGPNGHWLQAGAGELDTNPIQQALAAGFAISDSMRDFRRDRPDTPRATYRNFDTVVCFTPSVPAGSTIEGHEHVPILGYAELIDLLATASSRPMPWSPPDWDAYLRFLRVYPEADDAPDALSARQARAARASYRHHFEDQLAAGLHELVPIPATDVATGLATDAAAALSEVRPGAIIALSGPSGAGKSHLVRHVALAMTRADTNVIWAGAGEYDAGELSGLLARSVAPYTIESHQLILTSPDAGERTVLVIDGVAAGDNTRLIEQLAALIHRTPIGVIITATEDLTVAVVPAISLRLSAPDDGSRDALIRSYELNPAAVPAAVRSPFDIATLAAVSEDLPLDAAPWEIHDAFIASRTGSGPVRSGLRVLAALMVDQIRSTLRRAEVRILLERQTDLGSHDLDAVLGSPLLATGQGFIGFTHDLHRDLLAAEHVTATARSAQDLGDALTDPRRVDLQMAALRREPDPAWISEVLHLLARPALYVSAARGDLGDAARRQARSEIAAALAEAAAATDPINYRVDGEPPLVNWVCDSPAAEADRILLVAAGELFMAGEYVEEVLTVLERTDRLMAYEVERRRADGSTSPINEVVAATLGPFSDRTHLAVRAFLGPLDVGLLHPVAGVAPRLMHGATAAAWTRLYAALCVVDAEHEAQLIPDIVELAWRADGYYLRLQALNAARLCMYPDDELRERVAAIVDTFDVSNNWALSTLAVEILHAAGRIETLRTLEDVTTELLTIVESPVGDLDAQQRAYGAFISQFEDDIVGPYYDAFEGLEPSSRRKLLVLAAQAQNNSWALPLIIKALIAEASNDELALALERHASALPEDRTMVSDAVDAYVSAVRGWARLSDRLPDPPSQSSADERAWRLIGELLFHDARGGLANGVEAARIWKAIRDDCEGATIGVLAELAFHGIWDSGARPPLADLLERYAGDIRTVATWSLTHRHELTSVFGFRQPPEVFIFDLLGRCGDADTIGVIEPYVDDPELDD